MAGKRDTNVYGFWVLLRNRMRALGAEPTLHVVFRNRIDLRCRLDLSTGRPMVEVDDALRAAMDEVDHELVMRSLPAGRPRQSYENGREAINNEQTTSLNTTAVAVHGPRVNPARRSETYNKNLVYLLDRKTIEEFLGPEWASAAPRSGAYISIKDAARAAAAAGLVSPDDPIPDDDEDDNAEEDDSGEEDSLPESDATITPATADWDGARNEIWFGPPGTGKSFGIKSRLNNVGIEPSRIRRMTFHPETTYYDLIGTYRPAVLWLDDSLHPGRREPRTYYDFAPGPLSALLVLAALSPDRMHSLVIEEINRGNCAAIFGDVFQLLDRVERSTEGRIGESVYGITASPEWAAWLQSKLPNPTPVFERDTRMVRLPPNLLLLASMNTADQSLFPMDSAFKRRWAMRYVPISADAGPDARVPLRAQDDTGVEWRRFFTVVNERIVVHTRSDDKQMGPWFVSAPKGGFVSADAFCSKVLNYLWADVFRDNPGQLFAPEVTTFDVLVRRFYGNQDVLATTVLAALRPARPEQSDDTSPHDDDAAGATEE